MNGTKYAVADVYDTIQGEGAQAGTPMVLLRLQGCGVGCPWCDTKETWAPGIPLLTAAQVAAAVEKAQKGPREWVLITGGEPLEQHLQDLAAELHARGLKVALETSGTAPISFNPENFEWICVSPKEGMPGGKPLLDGVLSNADELKFVIGKPEDVERARALVARFPGPVVSLQPLSESKKATRLCVEAAMQYGWRLSLQQHKLLGLP